MWFDFWDKRSDTVRHNYVNGYQSKRSMFCIFIPLHVSDWDTDIPKRRKAFIGQFDSCDDLRGNFILLI